MAKMYQCDVCKNVYPGSGHFRLMMGNYNYIRHEFTSTSSLVDADVCPECVESIKHFIECKDPNHKSPFERDPCTG